MIILYVPAKCEGSYSVSLNRSLVSLVSGQLCTYIKFRMFTSLCAMQFYKLLTSGQKTGNCANHKINYGTSMSTTEIMTKLNFSLMAKRSHVPRRPYFPSYLVERIP